MKMQTAACLAATLMVGLTGCSTQQTTRGQSVQPVGHDHTVNTVPSRGIQRTQNYFHDQHDFNNTTSYQSSTGFPGYGGFANAGHHGPACPPGACPGGCGPGCGHHVPHHHHSFSYQRPTGLSYPQGPAGSVVYPYYTHKGPSDFFRDDGSVLGQ